MRPRSYASGLLRGIAPELVSAASDNDPTNVGTAAAVGAQTGYQLSWVALLVAPLLGVVLTIAAQVGAVARDDLQSLTLRRLERLAQRGGNAGISAGHEPGPAPRSAKIEAIWQPVSAPPMTVTSCGRALRVQMS